MNEVGRLGAVIGRMLGRVVERLAPSRPPELSNLDRWDGLDAREWLAVESVGGVVHADISDGGGHRGDH